MSINKEQTRWEKGDQKVRSLIDKIKSEKVKTQKLENELKKEKDNTKVQKEKIDELQNNIGNYDTTSIVSLVLAIISKAEGGKYSISDVTRDMSRGDSMYVCSLGNYFDDIKEYGHELLVVDDYVN